MQGLEFILARSYFTLAITFHIIFPTLNIGLSWLILFFESVFVKTGDQKYLKLCKFWSKIFAMLFGVGVISGIMMSFMFGLTFSKLIDVGGNVLGPLLTFEVLTSFFLEASFLGVMLFGWSRVGKKFHLFSTFCVAIGTLISAFWILSANSFMQTPAGVELKDGIVHVVNWVDVIFNPSFAWRYMHMIDAAIISASLFVFGISCYLIKKDKDTEIATKAAKISATFLMIASLLQVFLGDGHGLNTLKHQPSKIAALEAHWENEPGSQKIVLFAVPNVKEEKNDYEVAIPALGSIILTHSKDGKIPAIKDIPVEDRAPVAIPFYCFRIMVGLGVLFIILGIWGSIASRRGTLSPRAKGMAQVMRNISIWSTCLGPVAAICGWYVTEVGRQPWVVYGVMRAKDAMTPNLDPYSVLFGICFTGLVYTTIAIILVRYVTATIKKGYSAI
ncbi:cytochrome ubiquinol oxidase subunit I [Candidatus Deianiraea vastatrix]|uniref:Cytochrome bd ubiquinol oxidase subunit 1 n=1 Tax=Candidatus Deianiraea vastatrix TaxID=2163644 RepID=A0A5B8XI88_9RICK|nr:cytochrome ubiquinol oxidase subunit I [Candidatus Deianiraea vastatrix]QED23731.1 Cytochrome bd ubiquinol oxidase subunit 1 [Candidatus Deianiraea vastatrix]